MHTANTACRGTTWQLLACVIVAWHKSGLVAALCGSQVLKLWVVQIHQRFDPTGRADPARTEQAHIPEGFTKVQAYDEYPEKAYKDENKYSQQGV